jgi:hypothetical protein
MTTRRFRSEQQRHVTPHPIMNATHRRLAIASATTLVLVAACSNPAAPSAGAQIGLSARAIPLTPAGTADISYFVRNPGDAPVLLTTRCGERLLPSIERKSPGGWQQYAGGACLGIYDASPVPLGPGERRDDAAQLREAGEFRLVIGTDRGRVVSQSFTVR